MISLARKNLLREKLRFLISVGGVAFSVMLILVLLGLYRGWNEKLGLYIEGVNADVWVLQKGASDMFHSTSIVEDSILQDLANLEGVERVDPLVGRRVPVEDGGKDSHTIVMGYNTDTGAGGPIEVVKGDATPEKGEIIIDEALAQKIQRNVGDSLTIVDQAFTIAGLSRGGNVVTFQYSFVPINDARTLMQMEGLTNYALVTFDSNADPKDVTERIEQQFPDLDVFTKANFGDNNRKQITESFLPIIYVLVVIGFIVGLVVISLTIYTATIEKSREYGMLKAIGASDWHLYGIVIRQSIIAGLVGFVSGVGLTVLTEIIVARVEPSFVTAFAWEDVTLVFGITILMIVFATIVPMRKIVRIDPAIVFKT